MHRIGLAAALVTGILVLAASAVASGAIVPSSSSITPSSSSITPTPTTTQTIVQKGTCTRASASSLTVTTDAKYVYVAFQVKQNANAPLMPVVIGKPWSVSLTRDTSVLFSGVAKTQPPDASFTVKSTFARPITSTKITAAAKALDGSESCFATITI